MNWKEELKTKIKNGKKEDKQKPIRHTDITRSL